MKILKTFVAFLATVVAAPLMVICLFLVPLYCLFTWLRSGNWRATQALCFALYYAPQWWLIKLSILGEPDHRFHKISGPTEWGAGTTAEARGLARNMWFMLVGLGLTELMFIIHWGNHVGT